MSDNLKQPPHSLEAEQAVLGSVLLSPACFDEVSFLTEHDFYYADNRNLWAIIKADESGRDVVTLMLKFEGIEQRQYINDLARNTPSAANVKIYAGIVRDRAVLRRLLVECMDTMSSIYDGMAPTEVITGAVRRFEQIGDGAIVGAGPIHIGDLMADWNESFKSRMSGNQAVGLNIGFKNLNERWGGLRGGQVIVIAGRPKTGKTTLAVNIAEFVSMTTPVAIFQMEMGAEELVDRSVSSLSRIAIKDIRNGVMLQPDSFDSLVDAADRLKRSKMYIDATPRQTMDYIRLHSKAFVKKRGKGLIMIDYLGLIRSNSTSKTKNDEVAEISRDIKLLAKETDCPVILLCQMNRAVEREKRKPVLSDLRDSGAIEQDADVICFTHKDDPEQNYCEIITRAMRSGQPGTDYLMADFAFSRFNEPDEFWNPPVEAPKDKRQPKGKNIEGFGA